MSTYARIYFYGRKDGEWAELKDHPLNGREWLGSGPHVIRAGTLHRDERLAFRLLSPVAGGAGEERQVTVADFGDESVRVKVWWGPRSVEWTTLVPAAPDVATADNLTPLEMLSWLEDAADGIPTEDLIGRFPEDTQYRSYNYRRLAIDYLITNAYAVEHDGIVRATDQGREHARLVGARQAVAAYAAASRVGRGRRYPISGTRAR